MAVIGIRASTRSTGPNWRYDVASYIIPGMISASRRQAEAQRSQARQDLDELNGQVSDGELEPATAELLRAVYRRELEQAESAMAATDAEDDETSGPHPSRSLVAIIAVAVAVGGVLLSVGSFAGTRAPGAPLTGGFEGVARTGFDQSAGTEFDPAAYSDEALEAVVAANADAPEIAGMRIALADRYFSRGDYQAAFPHYQAVLEADPAPPRIMLATALSRLGWIVYDGNGEVALALGLLDRALELRPGDPFATHLKALVLWCGAGQPGEAIRLFEEVLASTGIDEGARATVEADMAAVAAGQSCR